MVTYDLMLERQRLIGADKFSIAANANETVCLRFHFDRNWRCFDSKAAVFRNSDLQYFIIEIIANRVKIPWEVLTKQGEFELSVIGFEGAKVITSDKVNITVSENLLPEEYKTFSPSEVLFDRFKRECTAQAYLDYEDEISELKKVHAAEKLQLGEQINEANERTQDAIATKNLELEELNTYYGGVIKELNLQISSLNSSLAAVTEKAEKWDMVDYALGLKTVPTYSLWAGGSSQFSLPMLNTSSITAFSASNFSANLKEIGLDLKSATKFTSIFSSHTGLVNLTLKNTSGITSFESMCQDCKNLRTLALDSLESCTNIRGIAYGATSLEKIAFEKTVRVLDAARAFSDCTVLKEIDGVFNLRTVTNNAYMFYNCASLETVNFEENSIRQSIDFGTCVRLSRNSMYSIINGLSDEASGTLTLSNYAFENNFTTEEEQEEILTFVTETKGWVLSLN